MVVGRSVRVLRWRERIDVLLALVVASEVPGVGKIVNGNDRLYVRHELDLIEDWSRADDDPTIPFSTYLQCIRDGCALIRGIVVDGTPSPWHDHAPLGYLAVMDALRRGSEDTE